MAQSSVSFGSSGLFFVSLGRISTGASFSAPLAHDLKLLLPLCTTFDHILALSSLLSSRNLKVKLLPKCDLWKARYLATNREDHHNRLCLPFWFFRHAFAYFFSCIPRPTA